MKKIPTFKSEAAEREYWATHSAAEIIDSLPAVEIEIITPRRQREQIALSSDDLEAIKKIARRKKISHRQLMQAWLLERLHSETT